MLGNSILKGLKGANKMRRVTRTSLAFRIIDDSPIPILLVKEAEAEIFGCEFNILDESLDIYAPNYQGDDIRLSKEVAEFVLKRVDEHVIRELNSELFDNLMANEYRDPWLKQNSEWPWICSCFDMRKKEEKKEEEEKKAKEGKES